MMRPLLALAVLFVACAAVPMDTTPVVTLRPVEAPRFVVLEDAVHDWLAREWDAHAGDWPLIERGRCVTFDVIPWGGALAFHIYGIAMPDSARAAPGAIAFACSRAPNVTSLHTHLPQSCKGPMGPCVRGGLYAHQCMPSDNDRAYLRKLGSPFALIQCDRYAVVAFWPEQTR